MSRNRRSRRRSQAPTAAVTPDRTASEARPQASDFSNGLEYLKSQLLVLNKLPYFSQILQHEDPLQDHRQFLRLYNINCNSNLPSSTSIDTKLRCEVLYLLISIISNVFKELEQHDAKGTTLGEPYADMSGNAFKVLTWLCEMLIECIDTWSLNYSAFSHFSTTWNTLKDNVVQGILGFTVLVVFTYLVALSPAVGGVVAQIILAIPFVAVIGYVAAHLCMYLWMQLRLTRAAAGLLRHLLNAFPSMSAAADTVRHQQQQYLDFLQTPAHHAAYRAAQNPTSHSHRDDHSTPPLNQAAVSLLPTLAAATIRMWLSLAEAQQQHIITSSSAMQQTLQPAVKLATRLLQDWKKVEDSIVRIATATLRTAAARDEGSMQRVAFRPLGGDMVAGDMVAAAMGAMLDLEKARSFAGMFKCPCCDDDTRDAAGQYAVGAAVLLGTRLAQVVCESVVGCSCRYRTTLLNASAVQRLRRSCPEVGKLLLLSLTCATQHLYTCQDGKCTLQSSSNSSRSSPTSSTGKKRFTQQQDSEQQQQQQEAQYHNQLLTAQGLDVFEPNATTPFMYNSTFNYYRIIEALDAFIAWHFPAEIRSSSYLIIGSSSSSSDFVRPWVRQRQQDDAFLQTDKGTVKQLPRGMHVPLLLLLLELQLLQPTLETMHKALFAMQLVHEQFVESLNSYASEVRMRAAMQEDARALKPMLLSLEPAVLQVATAAEADQQELAALVLEQLAVLVSDMAVSELSMEHGLPPTTAAAVQQQPLAVIPVLEAMLRTGTAERGAWEYRGFVGQVLEAVGGTKTTVSNAQHGGIVRKELVAALAADGGQQLQQQLMALLLTVLKVTARCYRHNSSSSSNDMIACGFNAAELLDTALGVGKLVVHLCKGTSSNDIPNKLPSRAAKTAAPMVMLVARSLCTFAEMLSADRKQQVGVASGTQQRPTSLLCSKAHLTVLQQLTEWLELQVQSLALTDKVKQQLKQQQQELQGTFQQLVSGSNSSQSSKASVGNQQQGLQVMLAQQLQAFAAGGCAQIPLRLSCNNPACCSLATVSELVLCGKRNANMCAGCQRAKYCSAECQKQHWDQHKAVCKQLRAKASKQ